MREEGKFVIKELEPRPVSDIKEVLDNLDRILGKGWRNAPSPFPKPVKKKVVQVGK